MGQSVHVHVGVWWLLAELQLSDVEVSDVDLAGPANGRGPASCISPE